MRANCAHCRWFVPLIDMTPEERDRVLRSAARRGYETVMVKGWCKVHEIPIIRYKGYCRFYEPNREPPRENRTLDKWLFGVRE